MSLKRKSCHLNICLSQLCQHKTQLFNLSCPWVLLLPCASILEDLKSSLGSRGSGKGQTGACRPGEDIEERWHTLILVSLEEIFFFFTFLNDYWFTLLFIIIISLFLIIFTIISCFIIIVFHYYYGYICIVK